MSGVGASAKGLMRTGGGARGSLSTVDPDLEVGAAEELRDPPEAAPQVEEERVGAVLLGVRGEEVEEEALPGAGLPEDERVRDVLGVEVEVVERAVLGLEERQVLVAQVRVPGLALREREDEGEVGGVAVREEEPPQVVGVAPGERRVVGVQGVVGLLEDGSVVGGEGLVDLGDRPVDAPPVAVVDDGREGVLAEVGPVHLHVGERLVEAAHEGALALVDEHVLGARALGEVRDDGRLLGVVVAPRARDDLAGLLRAERVPLGHQVVVRRQLVEALEDERPGLRRRVLEGDRPDEVVPRAEVVPVRLERGVRDEVVDVGGVAQPRAAGLHGVRVHEAAQEEERLRGAQHPRGEEVRDLGGEGPDPLPQARRRLVDVALHEVGLAPGVEEGLDPVRETERRAARDVLEDRVVDVDRVERGRPALEVGDPRGDRGVDDGIVVPAVRDPRAVVAEEDLVEAGARVDRLERGLEALRVAVELLARDALEVDPGHVEERGHVTGLREERRVVDPAVPGDVEVERPRLAPVLQQVREGEHVSVPPSS